MTFEILFMWGVSVFVAYQVGISTGGARERESQRLLAMADAETDPVKRTAMLLRWNELCEDRDLRRRFRKALLRGAKTGSKK